MIRSLFWWLLPACIPASTGADIARALRPDHVVDARRSGVHLEVVTVREGIAGRGLVAGTAAQVGQPHGRRPARPAIDGVRVPRVVCAGTVSVVLPGDSEVTRRGAVGDDREAAVAERVQLLARTPCGAVGGGAHVEALERTRGGAERVRDHQLAGRVGR